MADILLQKPAEGQTVALTPAAEDRLVFEFDPGEALLERDGENLVLSFEDGSVIELTDFYVAYTSENMPEFVIGEAIVPGEAFFAALGEELMPAAGNAPGPQGSGSGVGLEDPSLLGGIGREVRLDQAYPDDDDSDDPLEGGDGTFGGDGTGDNGTTPPPVDLAPTFDTTAANYAESMTTFDGGLRTDSGSLEFTTGDGSVEDHSFTITLDDGSEHTLNFDADGKATVTTEYGELTFTRTDDSLDYTYEQTKPYNHPTSDDGTETKTAAESFTVTITDQDGDSATTDDITIDIVDDAPVAFDDVVKDAVGEGTTITGNVTDNDDASADVATGNNGKELVAVTPPQDGTWEQVGDNPLAWKSDAGTITFESNGSYTFVSNPNGVNTDTEFKFGYTIKDADGDVDSATLTLDVEAAKGPSVPEGGYQVEVDESGLNALTTDDDAGTEFEKNTETAEWNVPKDFTIDSLGDYDKDLYDVSYDDDKLSITLKDNVLTHTEGGKEHNDSVDGGSVQVTVKDANGNLFNVDVKVNILDDGPIIESVKSDSTLLQEKFLDGGTEDSNADVTVGGTIEIDFGADGEASKVDPFAWDISTAPNLKTSDDDKEITWEYGDDKTTLIGKGADGQEAVRVEMNLETGEYTVTLKEAVEHNVPETDPGSDFNTDLSGTANNDKATDLNFGFTVTDGDGDTASSSVTVQIEDDVIESTNSGETVQMANDGTIDSDFDFYSAEADESTLQNALMNNKDLDDLKPDFSYDKGGYDVKFYDNQNADKSSVKVGGDNGFTITAAIVKYDTESGHSVDQNYTGLELGWRTDDSYADGKDYGNGIGIDGSQAINADGKSDSYGGTPDYEVGNIEGDYFSGEAATEAIIITLPDDELAYGVDLSFACLFGKGEHSADSGGEFVTLEFFKDGELVYSVKQLVGVGDGNENFDTSTVTVPFDEVRIIPTTKGSDFVLNSVDFSDYDASIVATATGDIETLGADGLTSTHFESITVGTQTVEFNEKGEPSGDIFLDGVMLELVPVGDNAYEARHNLDGGGYTNYFTVSVGDDGKWTVHQHEQFDDTIKLEIGIVDSDGDKGSHTVTVIGDALPEAFANTENLEEGQDFSGNIITDDTAGNKAEGDTSAHAGKEVTAVTAPDTGWTELAKDNDDVVGKFESDAGIITFNKDGSYTFEGKDNGVDSDVSFEFGYTITDADGDTSDSTLTLNLTDENVTLSPSAVTAKDENLADKNDANDAYDGAIGGLTGVDVSSVTIVVAGVEHTLDMTDSNSANTVIDTEFGNISNVKFDKDTGEITYTYTQDTAYDHGTSSHDESSPAESFDVVVTDKNGNTNDTQINVSITDDGPVATDDVNVEFTEGADDIRGNLLTNDSFGGDGFAGTSASVDSVENVVRVNGTNTTWSKSTSTDGVTTLTNYDYGTITIQPNGDYDFDSYGGKVSKDTTFEFDYSIKDADGDTDKATLTLEMTNVDAAKITATEIHVDESGLSGNVDTTGAAHDALDTGSIDVSAMNGVKDIKIGDTLVTFDEKGNADKSVTTDLGTISNIKYDAASGEITYSYTLNNTVQHDDPNSVDESEVGETLTVVVRDKDYNPSEEIDITINVEDDAPVEHKDYSSVTADDTTELIVEIDFGADNGAQKELVFNEGTSSEEIFTYNGDGSWTDGAGNVIMPEDDGTITLESGGLSLSHTGDGNFWTATVDTPLDKLGQDIKHDITLKDADGDSQDFSVTAKRVDEADLPAISNGTETQFSAGTNYNVSVILDTSGSMYHDSYGDIDGETTRLELACQAIEDFVNTTLVDHATSEHGGTINFQLTTFWGYTGLVAEAGEGVEQVLDLTLTADTFTVRDAEGTPTEYPMSELQSFLNEQINGLRDLKNDSDKGDDFHWQTKYSNGFNSAAEWVNEQDNDYENKVFFFSDGEPYGETQAQSDAAFDKLKEAIGEDGSVTAVGMGDGVDAENLSRYDTTGQASSVGDDDNFSDLFVPKDGTTLTEILANLGITNAGNDVQIGGTELGALRAMIKDELSKDPTDRQVVEFLRNDPDWFAERMSNDNDPDLLVAGSGNDLIYGEGGADLLIGDGNSDSIATLAEGLGLDSTEYNTETIKGEGTDLEKLADLTDAAKADIETLIETAESLENANAADGLIDGNDIIYGGDISENNYEGSGDDILLGLGGNDTLFGGSGDDILIGGSGEDKLFGGEGNDIISFDLDDVMVDGGEGMDVLLAGTEDLGGVKDMIIEGKIENVEMIVMGDDPSKAQGSINEDGQFDTTGWTEKGTVSQEGVPTNSFTQYESDDGSMTILVNQTLLSNNG